MHNAAGQNRCYEHWHFCLPLIPARYQSKQKSPKFVSLIISWQWVNIDYPNQLFDIVFKFDCLFCGINLQMTETEETSIVLQDACASKPESQEIR